MRKSTSGLVEMRLSERTLRLTSTSTTAGASMVARGSDWKVAVSVLVPAAPPLPPAMTPSTQLPEVAHEVSAPRPFQVPSADWALGVSAAQPMAATVADNRAIL